MLRSLQPVRCLGRRVGERAEAWSWRPALNSFLVNQSDEERCAVQAAVEDMAELSAAPVGVIGRPGQS